MVDGAEKAVKNMEMVPTDEEKIQQRIREHERLHDEIMCKKPDFSELADIAIELMKIVGDDEAVSLGDKVKVTTERYTDLVHASENIGHLLDESRQGLRHLVLTYQDLVAWMESMESRLAHYKIIPVHTEKLLEQMDMLVDLNEDIASRAPNVESTVDAGSCGSHPATTSWPKANNDDMEFWRSKSILTKNFCSCNCALTTL